MPAADHPSKPQSVAPQLALLLLAASFCLLVAFQTIELLHARRALSEVRASQESAVRQAIALRHQLDTIAGQTAQLAAEGNSAARRVVEAMRKQGITLTLPKKK